MAHGAGFRGGDGGAASAQATATGSGGGPVTVLVEQNGGSGGWGLLGGDAGDGADSILVNAISASPATGTLFATQRARGGNGGTSNPPSPPAAIGSGGDGGEARSSLEIANPNGELTAAVLAVGGGGGGGSGGSGVGGSADASLVASSQQALSASVEATGGFIGGDAIAAAQLESVTGSVIATVTATGGVDNDGSTANASLEAVAAGAIDAQVAARAGSGGPAILAANVASTSASDVSLKLDVSGGQITLGPVLGSSAGGAVTVDATVTYWRPGSFALENGIGGSTSGALTLRQSLIGLNAGAPEGGVAVRSALARSGSAASMALEALASGGDGGQGGVGASGGDAGAHADVTNETGTAHALSDAVAGDRTSSGGATSGDGGDASATAQAHAVASGQAASATGHARGGIGVVLGGHATSRSTAVAEGGGTVLVSDEARSGSCGGVSPCTVGSADSYASGESVGNGAVDVSALATGGFGENGDDGGAATAEARAASLGEAFAGAVSTAGLGVRATSHAFGSAIGTSGAAAASASSSGDRPGLGLPSQSTVDFVGASARRSGAGSKEADASIRYDGSAFDPAAALGLEAVAWASAEPTFDAATAALLGNANAAASITLGGDTALIALGVLGGGAPSDGVAETETVTSFVDFDIDVSEVSVLDDLQIAFLDPVVRGSGFQSVRLLIEEEGLVILNQTFTSIAAASAFFDDHAFALASPGRTSRTPSASSTSASSSTSRPAAPARASRPTSSSPSCPSRPSPGWSRAPPACCSPGGAKLARISRRRA